MGNWLSVLIVLSVASSATAQFNTGEISGVVRDSSGGVLPGTAVSAVHPASGISVERITDAEGRFFLPALRIGRWDISMRLAGFATQVRRGIVVEVGRSINLDFTLGVQNLSEEVVVQASLPMLQTTTAEISDVIDNREVVQLPLNGRAFLSLAQLSDASSCRREARGARRFNRLGRFPTSAASAPGHNIYLLDGTKITDELFNNLVISPSVDSIEEFKIEKSMYAAGVRRQGIGSHQRRHTLGIE